jgi:hypothetical protein
MWKSSIERGKCYSDRFENAEEIGEDPPQLTARKVKSQRNSHQFAALPSSIITEF